jgi:hypothetical protein
MALPISNIPAFSKVDESAAPSIAFLLDHDMVDRNVAECVAEAFVVLGDRQDGSDVSKKFV